MNVGTRAVENMIEADPSVDIAPPGYELAVVRDDVRADIGWLYSRDRDAFIAPMEVTNG